MKRVLFVCLGNICRSPMAHGAFRKLIVDRGLNSLVQVDSCGTGGHHAGEPPNEMTQSVAERRGYKLSDLRSRQLQQSDYREFDLLIAMDSANERDILAREPVDSRCQIKRFMSFVPDCDEQDVPDPWWAGRLEGFEEVCDLIEAGVHQLLDYVVQDGLIDSENESP